MHMGFFMCLIHTIDDERRRWGGRSGDLVSAVHDAEVSAPSRPQGEARPGAFFNCHSSIPHFLGQFRVTGCDWSEEWGGGWFAHL